MKPKFTFLLLLLCTAAASCSVFHVNSEEITTEYYPSKNNVTEIQYLEIIEQPHEVVALLTVNSERRQSMSEVIFRLKREAAILGADAITDVKSDATGTWKDLPAQEVLGNAYIRANFTASAVVLK